MEEIAVLSAGLSIRKKAEKQPLFIQGRLSKAKQTLKATVARRVHQATVAGRVRQATVADLLHELPLSVLTVVQHFCVFKHLSC